VKAPRYVPAEDSTERRALADALGRAAASEPGGVTEAREDSHPLDCRTSPACGRASVARPVARQRASYGRVGGLRGFGRPRRGPQGNPHAEKASETAI
jgi:hypothetical protein